MLKPYDSSNNIFYNGTSNYITGACETDYILFEITDVNGCIYQEVLTYQEPTAFLIIL